MVDLLALLDFGVSNLQTLRACTELDLMFMEVTVIVNIKQELNPFYATHETTSTAALLC